MANAIISTRTTTTLAIATFTLVPIAHPAEIVSAVEPRAPCHASVGRDYAGALPEHVDRVARDARCRRVVRHVLHPHPVGEARRGAGPRRTARHLWCPDVQHRVPRRVHVVDLLVVHPRALVARAGHPEERGVRGERVGDRGRADPARPASCRNVAERAHGGELRRGHALGTLHVGVGGVGGDNLVATDDHLYVPSGRELS